MVIVVSFASWAKGHKPIFDWSSQKAKAQKKRKEKEWKNKLISCVSEAIYERDS